MQKPWHPRKKLATSIPGVICALLPLAALATSNVVYAQTAKPAPAAQSSRSTTTPRASIQFFEVRGVSALPAADIRAATGGFVGWEQTPGNVSKAVEALEALYRNRGFANARVFLAGEDQARGAVIIDVIEGVEAGEAPPGAGKASIAPPPLVADPPLAAEKFTIAGFALSGVSLLGAEEIRRATEAFVGPDRNFGHIQQAIDAIEARYRERGFSAVQVLLPEQDISQGLIKIQVIETPLGKITVRGNQAYSADNIRRSLPALREGQSPNARLASQNVQLANENQGKQVDVVLSVGEQENTVDARIDVKEDRIRRFFLNADNTGTRPTGETRLGVGMLHNNLFDRDHSASLAYTTAPDAPKSVDINIFSVSYRVPFYGLGDSLSFLYGYSDVSTPTAQSTGFAINGKGNLAALRWNHHLARRGELSHQIVAGIDWKDIRSTCQDVNGAVITGTAGCIDYTTLPLSLAYSGRREGVGSQADFSLGLSYNLPTGDSHPYTVGTASGSDRYTLAAGNRLAEDNFTLIRLAGSYTHSFKDWLTRAALSSQIAPSGAIVSSEQFGLAGSQAVRGFLDRIVVADSGAVLNLEAYTPELASLVGLPGHNLRALLFVDYGYGRDNEVTGTASKELGSWGLGLRYQLRKDVGFRLDAASIVLAEPEGVYRGTDPAGGVLDRNNKDDWRVHASIMLSF